jgi:hypothetical protein
VRITAVVVVVEHTQVALEHQEDLAAAELAVTMVLQVLPVQMVWAVAVAEVEMHLELLAVVAVA